jgi:hypothetical protein
MTPSLKLCRPKLEAQYKERLNDLYERKPSGKKFKTRDSMANCSR